MKLWKRLLDSHIMDPDEARRQRLLNIIVLGLLTAVVLVGVFVAVLLLTGNASLDAETRYFIGLVLLFGLALVVLLTLSHRLPGPGVRVGFLLLLTLGLLFSDTPEHVTTGRSTLYFILPIIMSSVLLHPRSSFIFAGLIIVVNVLLCLVFHLEFYLFAPVTFLLAALISWLSANSLEQALFELRAVNRELDVRVTERTQALHAALEREQAEAGQARAILQSISDGVLVFDLEGRLAVANPVLERLTGRPAAELPGSSLAELLAPQVSEVQQQAALALFQNPGVGDPLYVDWGGQVLALRVAPVRGTEAQVTGTVVTLHDVTHEFEVSRMKNAFVAMVSHELRSPLSALAALVEMLQRGTYGPLNEKQLDLVRRIRVNGQELFRLVMDLLDQAKIEAGTLELRETLLSPAKLLADVRDATAAQFEAKGLALRTEIAAELPESLMGDPQRLQQILVNLVTNAIKFTDAGEIGIRFSRLGEAQWVLEVRDTGVGIAPEAQARIFEPFWQAAPGSARRQSGVGLGLAIVKKLVTLMHGDISLESAVGEGSVFRVQLPLRAVDLGT